MSHCITSDTAMALLLLTQSLPAYTGTASVVAPQSRASTPVAAFELNDLKALAAKQNPVLGYWDPLELASANCAPRRSRRRAAAPPPAPPP